MLCHCGELGAGFLLSYLGPITNSIQRRVCCYVKQGNRTTTRPNSIFVISHSVFLMQHYTLLLQKCDREKESTSTEKLKEIYSFIRYQCSLFISVKLGYFTLCYHQSYNLVQWCSGKILSKET